MKRLIGIFLHTVLLILFSFCLLNLPFSYDNESTIISLVSLIKNVGLGLEEKPDKRDFLLVNVSYQKALIPKVDEYGFEIGNEAITDREQLAALFSKVSESNLHKYIVCDVFLEQPSIGDSILLQSIKNTRNIIFPYHRIENKFVKPVIPVRSALSDYDTDFGTFLKYTFMQYDTCKTVALSMFQDIHHGTFTKKGLFCRSNGQLGLNSFIIEFPIRQFDIFREDTLGYNSIHLQNLLALPPSFFKDMVQDKIIIVGDFLEGDLHQTMYGVTAGPLIHLNAYLNLKNGRNIVSVWFFIYIFSVYFIFSWMLFTPSKPLSNSLIERLKKSKLGGFLVDYLKYAFFLLLMSVVSYLVFGIHLNILVISLYISIAEYGIEYYQSRMEKLKY